LKTWKMVGTPKKMHGSRDLKGQKNIRRMENDWNVEKTNGTVDLWGHKNIGTLKNEWKSGV
jgi:hypothetical protein